MAWEGAGVFRLVKAPADPATTNRKVKPMNNTLRRLDKIKRELCSYTEGCRLDMHEPDEQGLKAHVVGDHLDNACGNHIGEKQITEGFQEFVVVLQRDGKEPHVVNLADLIALARLGDSENAR